MSYFRFAERFRWPRTTKFLLLGLGIVAYPVPIDTTPNIAGVPLPFPTLPARADLLMIIESKGPVAERRSPASAAVPPPVLPGSCRRSETPLSRMARGDSPIPAA